MVVALVFLIELGRSAHRVAVELNAQAGLFEKPDSAPDGREVGRRDQVFDEQRVGSVILDQ